MTAVQVGSAYSVYELRYDAFTRGVSAVEAQLTRLQQLSTQVSKQPVTLPAPKVSPGEAAAAASAQQRAAAIRQIEQALSRQAAQERAALRSSQQLADSEIRAARAAGDHAGALRLVEAELGKAAQGTVRYNNLLAQQSTIQRQQAGGGLSGLLSGAGQALGGLGLAVGAQQLISGGIQAGQQALQQRQAETTLRALTRSTQEYAGVLQVAREQQILFGGSLTENIQGLSGLQITARQSGASLKTLIDLSQRLGVLDPEQGARGARIALSEALSGDVTSLSKRYEIPRAALEKLKDATIPVEDRLKILDHYLNKVGITSQVAAGSIDETTRSYNALGAAIERITTTVGGGLADTLAPAARGAARVADLVNTQLSQQQMIAAAAAQAQSGARDFADYQQRFAFLLSTLQQLAPGASAAYFGLTQLTQAEFEQARAAQQAADAAAIHHDGMLQSADAADRAAEAVRRNTDEVNVAISTYAQHEVQTLRVSAAQAQLDADSRLAAQGLFGAGDQAALLAQKYGIATDAARALIVKQQQLGLAQQALADQRVGERSGGALNTVAELEAAHAGDAAARTADAVRKQLAAISRSTAYTIAGDAGKLSILRTELAGLTRGTVAYAQKQSELAILQDQMSDKSAKTADKDAKAGETAAARQARQALTTERAIDTSLNTIENRYEDHYRKLQQMQEDYNLRGSRNEEDYQERRRKLLAAGQIRQARDLQQEFEKERRRAAEDLAIQVRRENEQSGVAVGRVGETAAIRGLTLPVGTPAPRVQTSAVGGGMIAGGEPSGMGGPGRTITINLPTPAITMDGKQIAVLVWPHMEPMVDQDLAIELRSVGISVPPAPQGQGAGVGGPRP